MRAHDCRHQTWTTRASQQAPMTRVRGTRASLHSNAARHRDRNARFAFPHHHLLVPSTVNSSPFFSSYNSPLGFATFTLVGVRRRPLARRRVRCRTTSTSTARVHTRHSSARLNRPIRTLRAIRLSRAPAVMGVAALDRIPSIHRVRRHNTHRRSRHTIPSHNSNISGR